MDELKDKIIKCADCNENFTFTVSEQEFYKSKGFTNEPKRCPKCRANRKSSRSFSGNRDNFNRNNNFREN